ncbi:cellobiose dehydrogenase-like protein [Westerdykella ornata]|uniref:Cellobiose dehydrogenase-like protein n=1 Tax=Westerdykella ornata TaxID=318751 RepID=A0A6A6JQ82_WESOR|nr:cellobiose dehydrogenase-like protein [Westerdykella ornata]KAF2278058.1 cellobiose dehydrogenase-like protein [Westerdykella ornata]
MRRSHLSAAVAALAGTAIGDSTSRYCDEASSICYSGWNSGNGVTIGVALPKVAKAPFDTVLQIISPVANGWAGFSWGGTMPYVPLTIGWPNNASNTAIYSSRMAYGLSLPQPYDAAEYTYLKGTGLNATHWTLNVRCRGCSQWQDVDGNLVSLNPSDTAAPFAHAFASKLPAQPANNRSTFNVHTKFGHWSLDLTLGQNEDFDKLVAANLVEEQPPASSSVSSTSSIPTSSKVEEQPPVSSGVSSTISVPTSVLPSTLSTSIRPTSTPDPVQTGVPSSCSGVDPLHFPLLTAPGWKAVKVAGGLTQPRGVIFDKAGNLLLVQNGLGITGQSVGPDGCLGTAKIVVTQRNLNHGIYLSAGGKTLFASSATSVFAWDYDAATMSVSGSSRIIVTGMDSKGHVTRTLTIPPKRPNLLVVSHGSNDNFDFESGNIKVGRSCVKVFDISKAPAGGYNYAADGYNLGYGLRNEVGLAFDGEGMLWGIENSSDEIHRTVNGKSVDIHLDNPADEINFLGDPAKANKDWYGYPTCYTVWKPDVITDRKFRVGDQFVLAPNATFSDETCKSKSKAAKLAIQAHSAPLDAVFNSNFTSMYITLHGSWNRSPSTGYKVIEVPFTKRGGNFSPTAQLSASANGYNDILWNPDVEHCSTTQCFRPVSIAKDRFERMYITSDSGAEGEIIILGRA